MREGKQTVLAAPHRGGAAYWMGQVGLRPGPGDECTGRRMGALGGLRSRAAPVAAPMAARCPGLNTWQRPTQRKIRVSFRAPEKKKKGGKKGRG